MLKISFKVFYRSLPHGIKVFMSIGSRIGTVWFQMTSLYYCANRFNIENETSRKTAVKCDSINFIYSYCIFLHYSYIISVEMRYFINAMKSFNSTEWRLILPFIYLSCAWCKKKEIDWINSYTILFLCDSFNRG